MKNATLNETAEFINGYAFKPSQWENSGFKIIRIQNLTDKSKPFNKTTFNVPKKYQVFSGDLLVAWSASLGVFEWTDETALLNQHIFKVIPKKDMYKSYLKFIIDSALKDMIRHLHGATMKHVNRKEFLETKIYLPEYKRQKRIADILDKADSLRKKRQKAIEQCDEFLKSTFLHMFGNPVKNPLNYNVVQIDEISSHIKDGPHVSPKYSNTGIPIISTRNIRPYSLIMNDVKYVSIDTYEKLTKRFKPQKNDVLLTKGGTTGYAKVVDFEFDFCVWVHIAVIRPNERVIPKYLESALNSEYCYCQSQNLTAGIANKDLGLKKIATIKLLLPPLLLQQKFASIIEKAEAIKQKMQHQLKELDDNFNSLMQRAFKGEL